MQQADKFFFGKSMICWERGSCEGGNLDAIIAKARDAKLSWIAFKAVDGVEWFDPDFNADLVSKVRTAGMKCCAWGYHYGGSQIDEEIRLAKVAMNLCDGYIVDAEAEFQGHPDWADKVATQLRGEIEYQQTRNDKRALLALTTYGDPITQSAFPYREFLRNCDVFMPQTYYNAWGGSSNGNAITLINEYGYSEWVALAKDLGVDARPIIPMLPVYQEYGYAVTGSINSDVMNYLKGYNGLTFWSWQHASQELWDSIANFNDLPFVGSDYPQPALAVSKAAESSQATEQAQQQATATDPLQAELDALDKKLTEDSIAIAKDEASFSQLERQNNELLLANKRLVDENTALRGQIAAATKPSYANNTWIGDMEVKDAFALLWGFVKYLFSGKK